MRAAKLFLICVLMRSAESGLVLVVVYMVAMLPRVVLMLCFFELVWRLS